MAEINILCLKSCLDKESVFVKYCFDNCEDTLKVLMLNDDYDKIPLVEFKLEKYSGRHLRFILIVGGLVFLLILLTLCIVGRQVYKSLNQKHLDRYHRLRSKNKDKSSRKNREYKKMRKFMKKVMRNGGRCLNKGRLTSDDEENLHYRIADENGLLNPNKFSKKKRS